MGRKNFNAFIKKQKEAKRRKKKEGKKQKKEERKSQSTGGSLDDMMAYLDKDGNITSEPPEENDAAPSKKDPEVSTGEPPRKEA